jgi:hypothetical protein
MAFGAVIEGFTVRMAEDSIFVVAGIDVFANVFSLSNIALFINIGIINVFSSCCRCIFPITDKIDSLPVGRIACVVLVLLGVDFFQIAIPDCVVS